jgi:hypothetical protein
VPRARSALAALGRFLESRLMKVITVEIVGYLARAISNSEAPHLTLSPYVIQTLLLLVAPPLFAASIYMILGRVILSVDAPSYSLIKPKWLTKVFVTSDVVCFLVQLAGAYTLRHSDYCRPLLTCIGAGLMASSHSSTSKMGSDIVLAGLVLQIVIFGFFVVLAMVFHRRLRSMPTPSSYDTSPPWSKSMLLLYITCSLILVRNIVRVAEFIQGFDGYIILHEVFLYVFDALPMLVMMVTFNISYPSNLSRPGRRPKEATEGTIRRPELSSDT